MICHVTVSVFVRTWYGRRVQIVDAILSIVNAKMMVRVDGL